MRYIVTQTFQVVIDKDHDKNVWSEMCTSKYTPSKSKLAVQSARSQSIVHFIAIASKSGVQNYREERVQIPSQTFWLAFEDTEKDW